METSLVIHTVLANKFEKIHRDKFELNSKFIVQCSFLSNFLKPSS